MKICSKCKKAKGISEFNKDRTKKDGLCSTCRECNKIKSIKHYYKNKHKIDKAKEKNMQRDYYLKNKERISLSRKKYYKKKTEGKVRRKKSPEQIKIEKSLRDRILIAIKRQYTEKAFSSIELLGVSIGEVRDHLEKQFKPGMTWENHGRFGWHIDHKIPCASFDLTDPEQQKECFHFSNLQPLWWYENLKKGAKAPL